MSILNSIETNNNSTKKNLSHNVNSIISFCKDTKKKWNREINSLQSRYRYVERMATVSNPIGNVPFY